MLIYKRIYIYIELEIFFYIYLLSSDFAIKVIHSAVDPRPHL